MNKTLICPMIWNLLKIQDPKEKYNSTKGNQQKDKTKALHIEDWHTGQKLSLLAQSLQRQRCLQGNKSMHKPLTLQALQVIISVMSLFSLQSSWKSMERPLQQEAESSNSLSPHPSLLSLLWAYTCWRLNLRAAIKFSLYLACCCQAPASTVNWSIRSSSSTFFWLNLSTSASFSRSFWRSFSSTIEIVRIWVAWTFSRIFSRNWSPYGEKDKIRKHFISYNMLIRFYAT